MDFIDFFKEAKETLVLMLCIFPTRSLLCFANMTQMSVTLLPFCLLKQWSQRTETMVSFQGDIKTVVFDVLLFNCSRLLFSLSPLLPLNLQGKRGLSCPTDIGLDHVLLRPMECGWTWHCHCCLISFWHLTPWAPTYLKWCHVMKESVHVSASVYGSFLALPSSCSLFSAWVPKLDSWSKIASMNLQTSEPPQPTYRPWHANKILLF